MFVSFVNNSFSNKLNLNKASHFVIIEVYTYILNYII
jgi:hypothetical protein